MIFYNLFISLRKQLKKKKNKEEKALILFPLDSTIISLTSKLLWQKGYHQVKLFSGINLWTAEPDSILIHFGQGHDSKYGDATIAATPENAVSIMDRGFCKLARIQRLIEDQNSYFLMRIRNDISLQMLDNGNFLVGGREGVEARVMIFSDRESGTEFRFVTNLPAAGEEGIRNEEMGEFYRHRW